MGNQQLINERSWGLTLIYRKQQYFRVNPYERSFVTTILTILHIVRAQILVARPTQMNAEIL